MPNAAPRRWGMFTPLLLVIGLALLWTVYWFVASSLARERFAAERQRLAGSGLSLACTEERWGGFPFHFEFTCTSPIVTQDDRAELRAAHLLMVALAYAPWQVVALVDGPTTVSAQGLVPTRVEHQRAIAALTFGTNWEPSLSSEIPALSVPGLGSAEKLMLHSRPSAEGGTEIAILATRPVLAPGGKPPLALDDAELLGTLTGGTSLRIDSLELRQGQLRYAAKGQISLDAAHRPSGQLDTETNDVGALLSRLSPYLTLTDDQRNGLRTMLGLLGNQAKAPIIARDGILYVGPFRVGEVQPLY